jgi:hypothetical protein
MKTIKFIRIFLLILIIVGIVLIFTQKIWVPKLVEKILIYQGFSIDSKTPEINKNIPSKNSVWFSSKSSDLNQKKLLIDTRQSLISPSGKYLFYSEEGDLFDENASKTSVVVFDNVNNTKREMSLGDPVFKNSFVKGNEYAIPVWSKDEKTLWLLLSHEVSGNNGIVSITINDAPSVKFYPFENSKDVYSFNPETGWFVYGDSDISSKCFSEGSLYPHKWNKYFSNIFTNQEQFIGTYNKCPGYLETKWLDSNTYSDTTTDYKVNIYKLNIKIN